MRLRHTSRRSLKCEPLERRAMLTALLVTDAGDSGPGTFRDAVELANEDVSIRAIVFDDVTDVTLDTAVQYTGGQPLSIDGSGASIRPTSAGAIDLLISSGGANLSLANLTLKDGANGIYVPVPAEATGVQSLTLNHVNVSGCELFGLHVTDKVNDSRASVHVDILNSNFENNGIGQSDKDGVRVDEGGLGNIVVNVAHSKFDDNGGDGLELDETGPGSVRLDVMDASFNANGFFDPDDLDDGLDIDEAGPGSLHVRIVDATANENYDQGLDLDEINDGNANVSLLGVDANDNQGEGIKIDEKFEEDANEDPIPGTSRGNLIVSLVDVEAHGSADEEGIAISEEGDGNLIAILRDVAASMNDKEGIDLSESGAGNLSANLRDIVADGNDDDGIQIEEADDGNLSVIAAAVVSTSNEKYGLKVEQGDDGVGSLCLQDVTLDPNGDGDLDTDGVVVKWV